MSKSVQKDHPYLVTSRNSLVRGMDTKWMQIKNALRGSKQDRRYGHETKMSSWLPPIESWDSGGSSLPYGWEAAIDKEGKTYFINHINRTTTYEDPHKDTDDEPPQPRDVELIRDPHVGFGFVAGSEKPVIVRFVTEGGPSENKLLPGDQIMKINGEDVLKSPREHVIELVRSCKHSVLLTVCQPYANNSTRKSALLTAAKKAKLKNNPSRVRFAEGVVINGSPLYSPSPLDSCIPVIPNVLKVFLENGQTKSFKYDSTTTVQDVLSSLQEKLSTKCSDHFSLVVEHIKASRRNKLALLDPKDTLSKIAARPGAHHLRCLFRVTFVPKDAYDLLQKDPGAFEYLYVQCCNDVVQERFAPELKYDVALRLSALHIQQHALSSGFQGKLTIKAIERECGLDRFVPFSLLETMKRKELRKLLSHFLKQNQSLCAPGQKQLTALQAKLHYLKIISELPSYGAKCFSTSLKDSSSDTALLISPKYGISQIAYLRGNMPYTLVQIEDMSSVQVTKEDEMSYCIEIFMKDPEAENLCFSLEDKEVEELILMLKGYYRLLTGRELPVEREAEDSWRTETVPCYHNRHTVREAPWSYPSVQDSPAKLHSVDLTVPPPPYMSSEQQERQLSRNNSRDQCIISSSSVDHNMNETQCISRPEMNNTSILLSKNSYDSSKQSDKIDSGTKLDVLDTETDYRNLATLDSLEDTNDDIDLNLFEAKNDEVIRRISEMNKIVNDAEIYLSDDKDELKDSEDLESERREEIENVEVQSQLKAADSLLLLTQIDDDSIQTGINISEVRNMVENEEISPSESDAESTSNDSPLHHSTPLRNSIEAHSHSRRRGSSFGLHSPDLLPGIDTTNHHIIDMLRQLQSCNDLQLPFAEGTLYLDPDIIDLTMIPPPITPDSGLDGVPYHLDHPPTPFLDSNSLKEKLDRLTKIGILSNFTVKEESPIYETLTSKLDSETSTEEAKVKPMIDSARVVAELDHLCDTLSEMQANSIAESISSITGTSIQAIPSNDADSLPELSRSTEAIPVSSVLCLSQDDDIDTFIASVTVPPPPTDSSGEPISYDEHQDDISAYIIPPPPSSSPSTEEQNEVLARFRQAADDIRRMIDNTDEKNCKNGHCCGELKSEDDLQENPRDISQFYVGIQDNWTRELKYSDKICNFDHNLPVINPDYLSSETLNAISDSETRGGDSSGYNTLTSSLTSYGETVLQDDIEKCLHDFDSELNRYVNVDFSGISSTETNSSSIRLTDKTIHQFSVYSSTSSPVLNSKQSWKNSNGNCVCNNDHQIESLITKVSKSSVSSVSKSLSSEDNKPQVPPRTKRIVNNHAVDEDQTEKRSSDDIKINPQTPQSVLISRSMSWNSISDSKAHITQLPNQHNELSGILKPPLPPTSPLLQSRFRRSLTKDNHGSASGSKKLSESSNVGGRLTTMNYNLRRHSPGVSPNNSPRLTRSYQRMSTGKLSSAKITPKLINGLSNNSLKIYKSVDGDMTYTFLRQEIHQHKREYAEKKFNHNDRILEVKSNSREKNHLLLSEAYNRKTSNDNLKSLENSCTEDQTKVKDESFQKVHNEISVMFTQLQNLKQYMNHHQTEVDMDKFITAKDTLIAESRQFVTASKFFVKSAMESSDGLIENMVSCISLMNRIFNISESVLSHMTSTVQMSALLDRLKGVALAYSQMVIAAQHTIGRGITNPQMGTLMHQATSLATALTSLMRTLRSLSAV
ncbi:FERM and PDZ domain-containing protein 4 isoform X3 [Centruroides vittatus]|uniref:FERM and PDZ domain-containing protein 4 isoform X3 n=1 Tax=Centruroides vittatus TaxID=120091 RepID=UPI003510BC04